MVRFEVILESQPEKYYQKVDSRTAEVLEKCFKHLEENPFFWPSKIKRLHGKEGLYRYAARNLRVVYEIDTKNHRVGVLAILPRGDIYKKI